MEVQCGDNYLPDKLTNDSRVRIEYEDVHIQIPIPKTFKKVDGWRYTGVVFTKDDLEYDYYRDKFIGNIRSRHGIRDFRVENDTIHYTITSTTYWLTINSIEELVELAKDLEYYLVGFCADGFLYFDDNEG